MENKPTEAQEQQAVVEWCDAMGVPVFHVPNGGSRHPAEAAHLKAQGVKPGVPDLFVPVARGGYHGLFVEMKRGKGGRLTKEQAEWIRLLRGQGYCAWCCHGAENAIPLVERYVAGEIENPTCE